MATFYKYQERDLDSQVNYADIGLGISNLVTDQLATRKAKKEAYDDQVRAFNQYLDEHPTGEEDNMTEWTASYASQMQQKMLANQRAFKNGRVSERDNVVFMQNVQNGTKTMFDLSADYQAEYKDKMERMNAADPANRSQGAETWLIEQFESFSNFKQTTPIINDKTGLLLLSKKNENGTFDTVSAADMATRIKAKYNYFDIDKATTDSEAVMGRFVTAALEEKAARGKQGMTSEEENKLNIQNKEKFDKGLATQTAVYLSIPNNTMTVLTNSIGVTESGKAYGWTFSKEEAANDPMKILMVKKEGSTGPPQPDFTTENGKKQQAVANKFYGDMLKSKVDYQGKIEVTSAIADKNMDVAGAMYGRSIQEQKDKSNLIADNIMKAFGSDLTNPDSAKEAMAYLGRLSPDLNLFKLTADGKLQSQLGTKYSNIPIKGKTIYDITKSMLMTIGTPLEIQTQVLKDVGAKGGKNKRLTEYETEIIGFKQEAENTPSSPYVPGFGSIFNQK